MKTIGFFGDSFCAGREPESWCVLLANRLNVRITHWGEPGRSVWSTFFKFNQFIFFLFGILNFFPIFPRYFDKLFSFYLEINLYLASI